MSLQTLIQQGNYESAQAAYDAITTPSIERRDDQLYTWAGIAEFAEEGTEQLKLAMEANGMSWAVHQFGGSGLPLSHPKIQAALLAFAAAGLPGCADLAAQGVSLVAPWQSVGITEPTLEQVTEAWESVQLANAARARLLVIQATRQKWDHISQQVRSQIETGQIESAQVVATVSQLWSE